MDIELQNLIEQDIDLGIKKNLYYNYETGSSSDLETSKFDHFEKGPNFDAAFNDLYKGKHLYNHHFEENQKVS